MAHIDAGKTKANFLIATRIELGSKRCLLGPHRFLNDGNVRAQPRHFRLMHRGRLARSLLECPKLCPHLRQLLAQRAGRPAVCFHRRQPRSLGVRELERLRRQLAPRLLSIRERARPLLLLFGQLASGDRGPPTRAQPRRSRESSLQTVA